MYLRYLWLKVIRTEKKVKFRAPDPLYPIPTDTAPARTGTDWHHTDTDRYGSAQTV